MRRRIATLLAMAVIGSGMAAGPLAASPALAASCDRDSCTGRDPHATGCDNDTAQMQYKYLGYSLSVSLIYSRTCHTWWGLLVDDDPTRRLGEQQEVRVVRGISTPVGAGGGYYERGQSKRSLPTARKWTPMEPDWTNDTAWACYSGVIDYSRGSLTSCTGSSY